MALAYEPDISGFADEHERSLAPRWTEQARSNVVPIRPAARSIYDMPISPLPAPVLDELFSLDLPSNERVPGVVLPLFAHGPAVDEGSPIDYRPVWVAGAFLAACLCAAVTVAPSWFAIAPADATSMVQRVSSQAAALIGVTGIAVLAAVLSTALLLVGAQRVERSR